MERYACTGSTRPVQRDGVGGKEHSITRLLYIRAYLEQYGKEYTNKGPVSSRKKEAKASKQLHTDTRAHKQTRTQIQTNLRTNYNTARIYTDGHIHTHIYTHTYGNSQNTHTRNTHTSTRMHTQSDSSPPLGFAHPHTHAHMLTDKTVSHLKEEVLTVR